jgi:hypothetical protein
MTGLGFNSWQEQRVFLFATVSRLVLGPTQPPLPGVVGAAVPRVKVEVCEADHLPPSVSKLGMHRAILPLPHALHGVVLN